MSQQQKEKRVITHTNITNSNDFLKATLRKLLENFCSLYNSIEEFEKKKKRRPSIVIFAANWANNVSYCCCCSWIVLMAQANKRSIEEANNKTTKRGSKDAACWRPKGLFSYQATRCCCFFLEMFFQVQFKPSLSFQSTVCVFRLNKWSSLFRPWRKVSPSLVVCKIKMYLY